MASKPKFWQINGFIAHMLMPLSVPYFLYLRLKNRNFENNNIIAKKLAAKIICVGNAVVGGAGKTPTAIKICQTIKAQNPNAKIAFISKGYKGSQKAPILVDAKIHTPKQVGDEPLLLANYAPIFVGKNRLQTCELAINNGFEVLILDDGMQDNSLVKDINFLVIDGAYGFGNCMILPAGPLRDRIDYAAKNISAAIIIGKDETGAIDFLKRKIYTKLLPEQKNIDFKVINAEIESNQKPFANCNYIGFAGIGRPEKFFDSLRKYNFNLAYTLSFDDHYFYDSNDENNLIQLAQKYNAKLITTEKDFVKLSPEFKKQVEVLKIELNLNKADLAASLVTTLGF
jgi:tetraacyldisaccharide 4'-kinase